MLNIKRILVVNRLTQYNRDVLLEGFALAKRFGAELSVLRSFSNPVDMEAVNAPSIIFQGNEYKTYMSVREQFKEELDKAMSQLEKDGIPFQEYVVDGDPVNEILRIVKEDHIDLVMVLAHEEGRLEHLLFGGENDALIRNLPCSLLLVKHEPQPIRWED